MAVVCMDVVSESGELSFEGWRCVACGNLLDPLIAQNRLAPPAPRVDRTRREYPRRLG